MAALDCNYAPLRRLVLAILDEDDLGVQRQLTEESLESMLRAVCANEGYFIDLFLGGRGLLFIDLSLPQADLLLMAFQNVEISYLSMKKLIRLLPSKARFSLLDSFFPTSEDYRGLSWDFISFMCQNCLYGVSMMHPEILRMHRTEVVSACQRLGSEWDYQIGGCFAARMPMEFLMDESFWVDALAHVQEDCSLGLQMLNFLGRTYDFHAQKRIACAFARIHPRSIISTVWATIPEVVIHAIRRQKEKEGSVSMVDDVHPSLKIDLDFVEEVAQIGGASFLFHTRLGKYYSTSARVLLASLMGFISEDALPLADRLHLFFHEGAKFMMAQLVQTIYSKRDNLLLAERQVLEVFSKYALMCREEEFEDFQLALVSIDPHCLRLLSEEKRRCRKFVTHAIRSNKEALRYVHPSIWKQTSTPGDIEEGLWQFVADLLSLGCSQEDIPDDVLRALGRDDTPGSFAAELLLRNRGAWEKLTPEQTSGLGRCSEFLCCICYRLPQEVIRCSPVSGQQCSAHYCLSCKEGLISLGYGSRCAHCRQSQLHFGEEDDSARSSEATITYILQKACRPVQKKRRLR